MIDHTLARLRLRAPATLWVTADWHRGHVSHDTALFHEHYNAAVEGGWTIIHLGDALELVTPASRIAQRGGLAEQTVPPEEQRVELIGLLRSFRYGVIGPGNHETRVDFQSGMNFIQSIVDAKDVRVKAVPWPGFVRVEVGRVVYHLYCHHGEGPIVNPFALHDRLMMNTEGADIIVAGHSHASSSDVAEVIAPDGERSIYRLRAGHYLRAPQYALRRPITRLGARGSWAVTLDGKCRQITTRWLGTS